MPDVAFTVRGREALKELLSFVGVSGGHEMQLSVVGCPVLRSMTLQFEAVLAGTLSDTVLPFFPRGVPSRWTLAACAKLGRGGRVATLTMWLQIPDDAFLSQAAVQAVSEQAPRLAQTISGCRILQRLLASRKLTHEQRACLMGADHVVQLLLAAPWRCPVVQAFLEARPPLEMLGFIVDAFRGRVVAAAQYSPHSRLLERLLEVAEPGHAMMLTEELISSFASLARHSCGTFVAQKALTVCSPDQRRRINEALANSLHTLAVEPVSSNVIRQALAFGSLEDRLAIADKLMADSVAFRRITRSCQGSWVAKDAKSLKKELRECGVSTTQATSSTSMTPTPSSTDSGPAGRAALLAEPDFDAMRFLESLAPAPLPKNALELETMLKAAANEAYED